jgi:hypothetical protein
MNEVDSVRYFRVERRDIVFLKFILEAYEGLSTMSTVDNRQGIVSITFGDWAAQDVSSLVDALSRDIGITEVAWNTTQEECCA